MLKVTNSTQEKVTYDLADMVGIVDLRSLGYYKVKQGVLQQIVSKMYNIESGNVVCNQFKIDKHLKERGKGRE